MILIHQQVALVVYYFHPCFSISNKSSGLQKSQYYILSCKVRWLFCNDIHACTPLKQLRTRYSCFCCPYQSYEEAVWYEKRLENHNLQLRRVFAVNFETECRVRIDGQLWIQNGTATIPQRQPAGICLLGRAVFAYPSAHDLAPGSGHR